LFCGAGVLEFLTGRIRNGNLVRKESNMIYYVAAFSKLEACCLYLGLFKKKKRVVCLESLILSLECIFLKGRVRGMGEDDGKPPKLLFVPYIHSPVF
jgi:hypothetical protein